jgi:hypothetical protein
MSTKCLIFLAAMFSPFVLGITSCKKGTGAATPSENIVGTWKLSQYAYDDNNDGVIESAEIHNQPEGLTQQLAFNGNQGGVLTTDSYGISETHSFIWGLSVNDYLQLEYAAHDTVTYYLLTINSSNLILTTTTNSVLQWYSYIQ